MRKYSNLSLLIVCAWLLSACSGTASATPEAVLQNVYTAAAMTLSVQAGTPTATGTVMPMLALPTMLMLPTSSMVLPTVTAPNTISYSTGSTANGCNDASYVSDVTVPDGTVLSAGESFTKTWEFQNTGACDWDEDYLIIFVSGSDMDGVTTEIDQDVVTGTAGEISVALVAPSSVGTYTGYWSMATSDGAAFGQSVYVQIVVSTSATTTATATTASSEATSTPTATTQPTSTFTATSAPTSMPTETPIPATAIAE